MSAVSVVSMVTESSYSSSASCSGSTTLAIDHIVGAHASSFGGLTLSPSPSSSSSPGNHSTTTSPTLSFSSADSSPTLVNSTITSGDQLGGGGSGSHHNLSIGQRRQGRRKNLKLDIETARQYRSIGKLSFHFGGSQSSSVVGPVDASADRGGGLFSPTSHTANHELSCSGHTLGSGLRPIENHIGNPHFMRSRKAVSGLFSIAVA